MISNHDAAKKLKESLVKDAELTASNMRKLEEMVDSHVTNSLNQKKNHVSISFCADPEVDNGTKQFLISEKRKNFDHYYDKEILNNITEAGFKNVKESCNRDGMSGVLHYTVTFNITCG